MSLHINRFLERLKAAEGRRERELVLTVAEARDLHTDISRLLLALEELRSSAMPPAVVATQVEISGGSF